MKCEIIFTSGYDDDGDSLMRGYRSDVLLHDHINNYYSIDFVGLETLNNMFQKDQVCYLNSNMVLLHKVTKENILKSVPELYQWQYSKHWRPLTDEQVLKYYYPKENWKSHALEVSPKWI